MAEGCVFCGVPLAASHLQQKDSRTKEHVYAKWFREAVVNKEIKLFTADANSTILHNKKRLAKFWNDSVCADCNNGWMSRLEVDVDRVFERLTTGTDISALSSSERDVLARWAGKTAIVLGYVTPSPVVVPENIRRSFLPSSPAPPQMRLFYAFVDGDKTLEGAYLQIGYGKEIGIVGESGSSGLRFTLCVYNHMLTVDFPPMLAGLSYDLSESVSAQIWPYFDPAGTAELDLTPPVLIQDLLHRICSGIKVRFDFQELHV